MHIPQLLSIRRMRRPRFNFVCLHMLLVALPFGIEYTAGDSSETNVHLSFGQGNYASIVRGCEDTEPSAKHQFTFADIGLQVDHLTASHFRFGIRGSYIFDQSTDVAVINPFVNVEWRYLALGGGYVYSDHGVAWASSTDREPVDRFKPDASFYLRLGDVRKLYLSTSLYHSVPLYSRGHFQLGIGGSPHPRWSLWVGMGSGPYSDVIGIGAIGYEINRHLTLNARAGFGEVEGLSQNSFNIGLKLRIPE